jgi:hypothetical protein
METNRLSALLGQELKNAPKDGAFVLNPLAASILPWQAAIYRAAFEQARTDIEKADDGFPWAENWN